MKVWIYVKGAYTDSPDLSFDRLPYDYGITGIHEMLHQIGKFMYSEAELDKAASDLGSKGVDNYLKANCVPSKFR